MKCKKGENLKNKEVRMGLVIHENTHFSSTVEVFPKEKKGLIKRDSNWFVQYFF